MDHRAHGRLPLAAAAAAAFLSCATWPGTASAHVKWFCIFDVAGQPRGLENVLCPDFEGLVGLAVLGLMAGCLTDGTAVGHALLRALDRATSFVRANAEILIRATVGFFLVALWTIGGIILTPELKTSSQAVSWLQLAMAAGLLWRPTMPLSACGIVALFALAVHDYGIFHLADYPIFLGIAAYLALTGLKHFPEKWSAVFRKKMRLLGNAGALSDSIETESAPARDFYGVRPLDIARYAAAVTLMWASIEKWAYPEWSFPLFVQYPSLTLGFDDEFFMRAAGVIEFTLAFALIWTPLVRRLAATILAAMFVSAVFEFGKIDAIGHAPIVVILLAIVADDAPAALWSPRPAFAPIAFCVALTAFLSVYYVAHAMLFHTQII
jgi:hypothetical protein